MKQDPLARRMERLNGYHAAAEETARQQEAAARAEERRLRELMRQAELDDVRQVDPVVHAVGGIITGAFIGSLAYLLVMGMFYAIWTWLGEVTK